MPRKLDEVTKYAKWAVKSKNKVGKLGRLSAERHLRDLDQAKDKGWTFDVEAANRVLQFFPVVCRHSKGEWAGEPVELSPNQKFRIGCVFGWKREDGLRRFRTAYNTEGRKGGKSTLSAGVGLYMMTADHEGGAEIFSYATTRDQAKIVFEESKNMVMKSPSLKSRVTPSKLNLAVLSTASKFEPLSADKNSLDGLNPHCAIGDEIHAHRSRAVYDVIETAMGARRQPLHWLITTRGVSQENGICQEVDDYSIKVLKGEIEDDTWFAYIACLDDDDEWDDEDVWVKANPNLGISVKLDDLQRLCTKAKFAAGARAEFKKKRCNLWISSVSEWLDAHAWQQCGGRQFDEEDLRGQSCYGGLDLSGSKDLTSLNLLFDDIDGTEKLLSYFWLPEKDLEERTREENVPWTQWAEMGYLRTTPGAAINKAYVARDIAEILSQFDVKALAYDRWRIEDLLQEFDDIGFETRRVKGPEDLEGKNRWSDAIPLVDWGQGFRDMSPAVDEVEAAVADARLRHGENPILTYCVSNVAVSTDPAGNRKLDKQKSRSRIDGAVGMTMAYGVRARMAGSIDSRQPLTAEQILGVIN